MEGEGIRRLPGLFLAYPSEPEYADGMRRLADELRGRGATATLWEDLTEAGFLFEPIAQGIRDAGLVLAETTNGNANVLFEVGYALAKNKPFYWLQDDSVADPVEVPPLSIVRGIKYSLRNDVVDFLDGIDELGEPIIKQMGIHTVSSPGGRLYFIPSPAGGDANEAIWRKCEASVFDARRIDYQDVDYDSLASQARSIAEADACVTLLVSTKRSDAHRVNAQSMLYAGIAAGLEKDLLVLAQEPLPRLLDLGDRLISFRTESEAEYKIERWLGHLATARLSQPAPRPSVAPARASNVEGLFFGSLDASADFELSSYFVRTPEFAQAERGQRHLFVGAKGSGKTADFVQLQERFRGSEFLVVTVAPAAFEFPRLAAVFDEHLDLAHWEFVYGSFWRFILITEIIKKVQEDVLDHLLREPTIPYARGLLKWISDNGQILAKDFASRVSGVMSKISGIEGDRETKRLALEDLLQTARMYEMERSLRELGRQFEIRLLIDDLDRNWSPQSTSAQRLVTALLSEIESLMRRLAPSLKPCVFIRRDVFAWLEKNDSEIMKRDPGFLRWDRPSLEIMIASRIQAQLGTSVSDPDSLWKEIFPEHVRGEKPQDFIISRTLQRPRDVIQFCQKALECAQRAGAESISEDHVYEAWEMSGERILAQVEVEYQARYPGLGSLALAFFEGPARMKQSEAIRRLADARKGLGTTAYGTENLVHLLYQVGVLGACSRSGEKWFEADRPLADLIAVLPADFEVIVHPAFQRYLRCA